MHSVLNAWLVVTGFAGMVWLVTRSPNGDAVGIIAAAILILLWPVSLMLCGVLWTFIMLSIIVRAAVAGIREGLSEAIRTR